MTEEYLDQPAIESWIFQDELKTPVHNRAIRWKRKIAGKNEIALNHGVSLDFHFPDSDHLLDTAYQDFHQFLSSAGIPEDGQYIIRTCQTETKFFEEYTLEIRSSECLIKAHDTEGIRRGLVALENLITSQDGPFLKKGKINRRPLIKTRLARCCFGPINRPPLNRDELADDIDYYDGEYLNRLVHEGINALWICSEFNQLCPSEFFPDHGVDSVKRLSKLRKTVAQCRRYGISIYLLCNEPMAFGGKSYILSLASTDDLQNNPYFAGHRSGNKISFCISSPQSLQYLENCTHYIFSQVPDLGGIINISFGERPTHCYSSIDKILDNNCPRCSKRKVGEIFYDMLSAMAKGMHKVKPTAQLISWLYIPAILEDRFGSIALKEKYIREIAAATPENVTLQINFESNGKVRQLGRTFTIYDYHLAYPGPSRFFEDWSAAAIANNASVSAKIQVGCSHENATIPFMPVPGSVYRKYKGIKRCRANTVMQSWYFGSFPGLMNKAAGELSFLPFPRSEKKFLESLARIDWGEDYKKVVAAWQYFMKSYSAFPMELSFGWFGPLHCSIVWPLHLFPVDQPIAPSWEFGFPDSGDRIGECIGISHTLTEVLKLLKKMNDNWQQGMEIFKTLKSRYRQNDARLKDIGVAEAVGLQINSAFTIFSFYDLREKLPYLSKAKQRATLAKMAELAQHEIFNSIQMRKLCMFDSRLGFHAEAEGYKFFPLKLQKRIKQLKKLLREDFPKVSAMIERGELLFPEYTGKKPQGNEYHCTNDPEKSLPVLLNTMKWLVWHDDTTLYFRFHFAQKTEQTLAAGISIEPRRLWTTQEFFAFTNGKKSYYDTSLNPCGNWNVKRVEKGSGFFMEVGIPFNHLPEYQKNKPLRFNVSLLTDNLVPLASWNKKHPLKPRLLFGDNNSADLGWLFIE